MDTAKITGTFHIRVNGKRLMRVTAALESFVSCGDEFTPVDIRDARTGTEAQAIVDTRFCHDPIAITGQREIREAIRSAYTNATKETLPERFSVRVIDRAKRYRSVWRVMGRNGYWPIEQFQPDNPDYPEHCPVGNAYISPRMPRKDANAIAEAMQEAWRLGALYGQQNPTEEI